MTEKSATSFNVGKPMESFMNEVAKTLVQENDYRGIGGHAAENHGGHGSHSQTSIGMGATGISERTINIRQS